MNSFLKILILTVAALGLACDAGPTEKPAAGSIVVADDIGRRVELPAEVTRAVSLAPNITEIVFAVGAGDKLVGATTFCDFPDAAKEVERVGDTLKPNIETIVSLRPDVVFVSTASQLEAFTGVLERQGIRVFVTSPDSISSVFGSMLKIGQVLGREKEAGRAVSSLRARVGDIEKRAEAEEVRPRVFVQIDGSLYTVGKGSFITDLVERAGGIPVTGDIETAYPKISSETAKAFDPDVIILSDSPDNREPNSAFSSSMAVRRGRVARIDADVLSRPGPRIVDALELIFKALHGRAGE